MTRTDPGVHGGVAAYDHFASDLSLGVGQSVIWASIAIGIVTALIASSDVTGVILILLIQVMFLLCALWRVLLAVASRHARPAFPPLSDTADLPRYSVLVALLDEADVLPQLVERLTAIDYPPDRLDGFLILEAHDHVTIAAAEDCDRPDWLKILIAPAASPKTKPRALNHGLAHATGEFVTVYDAEDDPDPYQLQEAASRFQNDRSGALWTLQAPLRIRTRHASDSRFLDRQFAVEYASLFEVTLPAMTRLGLPFPLGGTSNHFRVDALRSVGGWDAYNVTEDADLGFRMWRAGGSLGVLTRPTYEAPPGRLVDWLPQRTRWLKGYMQTWGVHTRDVRGLGWRGGIALTMTLGASLAAAAVHAASLGWVLASMGLALAAGVAPDTPQFSLGVLFIGTGAAWLNGLLGARRAGISYTLADMLTAPAYWSLLTLGFFHALWRLILEPHAWDKTRHRPDPRIEVIAYPQALDAGREAA